MSQSSRLQRTTIVAEAPSRRISRVAWNFPRPLAATTCIEQMVQCMILEGKISLLSYLNHDPSTVDRVKNGTRAVKSKKRRLAGASKLFSRITVSWYLLVSHLRIFEIAQARSYWISDCVLDGRWSDEIVCGWVDFWFCLNCCARMGMQDSNHDL